MTDNSAFKKTVRARMKITGEKYTSARRGVLNLRNHDKTCDGCGGIPFIKHGKWVLCNRCYSVRDELDELPQKT